MQAVTEHALLRPRKSSTASRESYESTNTAKDEREPTASISATPAQNAQKPYTLSGIAHRAIGNHNSNIDHHGRQESYQDPAVVGGDHPGLDRSQSSGRFSKGMPNTPWTNTKVKEMRHEENEQPEDSPEDTEKKELAVKKIRHVMGVSRSPLKDQDERDTKEDQEERATREAIEKLTLHVEGRMDGHARSTSQKVNPHNSSSSQMNSADMDIPLAQKPKEEYASYPVNDGCRPDHRHERETRSAGGVTGSLQERGTGPVHSDAPSPTSISSRRSNDSDIERLPPRAPKKNVNGDVPEALAPSKEESPPGPRNDINLRPRIPDMHFHTAKESIDIHDYADQVPLHVAVDGENELLPNGKPLRHAPDPENRLTSTRAQELKVLGLDGMKDGAEQADYSDDRLMNAAHSGRREAGGLVSSEADAHNGEDEEDDAVPAMRGSGRSSGYRQIPRATHEAGIEESLVSANGTLARPAKTGRLWSTFRGDKTGGMKDGDRHRNHRSNQGSEGPVTALDNGRAVEGHESVGQKKWQIIRQKLLPNRHMNGAIQHANPALIPMTSELLAGQLPVMILKTWIDRDESGHRAVPVLLGNLRFRVGDSAGMSDGQTEGTGREVFRIECEYGDGCVKWVIYRELRDFWVLHSHYKTGNLGNKLSHLRGGRKVEIPEFPRSCIPYISKLRRNKDKLESLDDTHDDNKEVLKEHQKMSREEISKVMRHALQRYLVDLIRAVMFRPESNRLCRFFELSALTVSLAPRGGFQSKAGFLKIKGSNASARRNQPGLTPTSWAASREPRWCIVRDGYIVFTDGPESMELYDVFIFDSDFAIERPKRILRKTLKTFTGKSSFKAIANIEKEEGKGGSGTAQADRQARIAAAAGSGAPIADESSSSSSSESSSDEETGRTTQRGKKKGAAINEKGGTSASQHTFFIISAQRRVKLSAGNIRLMQQFIIAMERVAAQSVWCGKNRFDSFAPIRMNVAAQWLVDGRDYFWSLSRAINMAKETIYIHDWWISPELYLRRGTDNDDRYRLDNLLKRKAEEGVKIFVIIYNEVSDKTTPTDSQYTKKRLMGLHPNIMVQRSPSHLQSGILLWSHHEKLCVIDEAIAFMGGLDLCFGRWDTPQHILIDEDFKVGAVGKDGPIWPGKDMSNERVVEYHTLNKPFEDMFDRTKVPRMPWHDVGLQIVGQPARDLCRHFVQRWNLLIRNKNHSRPMPFLLPPSDFTELELKSLGLAGTCEIQICRSCGPWSMGTVNKVEHSIQNAYLKAIQLSEHFVYIENQFFITSTVVDGVEIENRLGDALVDRIIRAHREGTPWRACIVIPLLPGYPAPLDTAEASSVRLILECQNRTICRGTQSIFSRLRKEGIDPDDYISFFSLRGWSKFKSGALTTEQVYIHGKTMVVDDRLVICGSANINERSQRGDRDSELAAVIRDTDMIESTMAGKPYMVGRFAHTLRMRLMREHVGVDVDALEEDQLISRKPVGKEDDIQKWDPDHEQSEGERTTAGVTRVKRQTPRAALMATVETGVSSITKGLSENAITNIKKAANVVVKPASAVKVRAEAGSTGDQSERQDFGRDGQVAEGFASSIVPTLEEKTIYERRPSARHTNGKPLFDVLDEGEELHDQIEEAAVPEDVRSEVESEPVNAQQDGGNNSAPKIDGPANKQSKYGAPANANEGDDSVPNRDTKRNDASEQEQAAVSARKTLRKHLAAKVGMSPWTMPTPTPLIEAGAFTDPLRAELWKDQWVATAVHNTEIFRKVFRCVPDDLVTSWASYKAFTSHAEKFNKVPANVADSEHEPVKIVHGGSGPHGAGGGGSGGGIIGQQGSSALKSNSAGSDVVNGKPRDVLPQEGGRSRMATEESSSGGDGKGKTRPRESSAPGSAWHDWELEEMEELLQEVRGHLVIYPTRFMEAEDLANNFLFNSDKILPLPIYD